MHIAIAAPGPLRGYMLCPVCRDDHVVPASLSTTSLLAQHGEVRIDQDGLHLDPAASPVEGGSAISLTFRCRHGHVFSLRLRTIYNRTTVEAIALPFAITSPGSERN